MPSTSSVMVGGFFLGGLAIAVGAILFFGGGDVFVPKEEAVVYFDGSVDGLVRGTPVTFRGVRVGSVAKVAVEVEDTGANIKGVGGTDLNSVKALIPAYLELEPDRVTLLGGKTDHPMVRRLVEAGLRAKLESQSFVTGQKVVELGFEPDTPAHFRGKGTGVPEIPTIPSEFQELRRQLVQAPIAETVIQAEHTLAAVAKLADRIDDEIDPLATDARRVLAKTEHMVDDADATIVTAGASIQRLQQDASGTLGRADTTLGAADAAFDEAHALAQDGRRQLAARGEELSRALVATQKTLRSVDGLMTSANGLIELGSQPRSDIEATLRDLAASTSALRDFSQSIDRDPSVVLRGRASR